MVRYNHARKNVVRAKAAQLNDAKYTAVFRLLDEARASVLRAFSPPSAGELIDEAIRSWTHQTADVSLSDLSLTAHHGLHDAEVAACTLVPFSEESDLVEDYGWGTQLHRATFEADILLRGWLPQARAMALHQSGVVDQVLDVHRGVASVLLRDSSAATVELSIRLELDAESFDDIQLLGTGWLLAACGLTGRGASEL